MMMSKPAPEKAKEEDPPAFATVPATKKKTAQSAVEDLERRLAMLGGSGSPPDLVATDDEDTKPTAPAPVSAPAPVPAVAVKGGKNALLVSGRKLSSNQWYE